MARAAYGIGIKIAARAVWILPTPTNMSWTDTLDSYRWKIPLLAGGKAGGESRGGVTISLQGQINRSGTAAQLPDFAAQEQQMRLLRQHLLGDQTANFRFQLHYSTLAGALRYFKDCELNQFSPDLSDAALIVWTAQVVAFDPVIYTA